MGLEHISWTLDDENRWILPGREQRKGGECQGGQYRPFRAIEAADAERLAP
jgi:hypothetical protein